jgi:hypothetical protein
MNTTAKTPDLSKLQAAHENQWVALAPDDYSVLASGETLAAVREEVSKVARTKTPVFLKVLPAGISFSPRVA